MLAAARITAHASTSAIRSLSFLLCVFLFASWPRPRALPPSAAAGSAGPVESVPRLRATASPISSAQRLNSWITFGIARKRRSTCSSRARKQAPAGAIHRGIRGRRTVRRRQRDAASGDDSSDTEDIIRRQIRRRAARGPVAVRHTRRRSAAARRHRALGGGTAAGRGGRPVGQLGVQPSRLGLLRRRGVEPRAADRRERQRRSHHPRLEDHARRRARSRDAKSSTSTRTMPVKVERRERDFNWLVVKALGEHWSVGARGRDRVLDVREHQLAFGAAPADRVQRVPVLDVHAPAAAGAYAIGVEHGRYYEETLYGKIEETLPQHELSLTLDQRERWGSLAGPHGMVAVPPRPQQVAARSRGRGVRAPRARAFGRRPR